VTVKVTPQESDETEVFLKPQQSHGVEREQEVFLKPQQSHSSSQDEEK